MRRVLVTGGDGLLAYALKVSAPKSSQYMFLKHDEFDLTRAESMRDCISRFKPDVIVNTAAYNLVDRCETERDLSWAVNAIGPEILAGLCLEYKVRLVHFSTDYVFDGAKKAPYVESDIPNPLNHYAAGKLTGENAVLAASKRNLVLRTSWVFGWHPTQAKSFVHSVLKAVRENKPLKVTTDQVSVPTFAVDLASWTLRLIEQETSGLFHAVNDEGVSRFDWTEAILGEAKHRRLISAVPPVEAVTSAYFSSTMRRPDYTVMDNGKLTQVLGAALGSWRGGVRKMLAQM